MVRKEVFADDFAALKVRLGPRASQSRAGHRRNRTHLKEAADAFSAATTIWTITDAPDRWADIQNSLGGLLITMGRLTREPGLFDRAVEIFVKIAQARAAAPRRRWYGRPTLANIGTALKEKGHRRTQFLECLHAVGAGV